MDTIDFVSRQLTFHTRDNNSIGRSFSCPFPCFCCACQAAAYPLFLSGHQFPQEVEEFADKLFAFAVCPSCGTGLVITYSINGPASASFVSYTPTRPAKRVFDKSISNISDRFTKIYNQALAAETLKYDEIAGMGYRKALEILIKDFLISRNPNDKENIINSLLSSVISERIKNDNLKTMATRAVWLGNDHAHYYQKHTDKDLNDLKRLIEGILSYINIDVVTGEALEIEHK